MVLLLLLVREQSGVWTFVPGLLLMGLGVGVMITASVNVVQSSFGDEDQGEVSGVSRSASNLGSSLGTALAGSVLVAAARPGGGPLAIAMGVLAVVSLIGPVAAAFIPKQPVAVPGP
jgi:predicted MFS family arabinose efflux permease